MFEPGTLLEGRFRVASLVGEGGMGAVYRAIDESSGEPVAIKVLKATVAASARERFVREARVLAALDHPGIVRFKHMGSLDDGQTYLVMEWLDGEDLAKRNERQGVTFLEAVRVARGAAEALASAHAQGLVHRDVKPANLFLVGGRPENIKVLDFGIARGGKVSATLTDPGMALGTPAYMAPEQARGGAGLDARTDLFALGCVLYECLAGSPPFVGDSPIACLAQILLSEPPRLALTVPGVPRALDALVSAMLQKQPADRPETAAVVARELSAVEPLLHVEGSAGTISARQVSLAEKRIASIVVVRDVAESGGQETGETLSFAAVEHTLAPARESLERSGGTLTVLSDGTLLGVFSGAASATDLARAAANAALDLRARVAERAIAIATDLASVSGTSTTGAAVSRAFGLATAPGVIRVDATTRALIGDAFVLRGTEGGTALEADRSDEEAGRETIGRARELASIRSALAAATEDQQARAVLLIGPAGQGKSCLVRAFLRGTAAGPAPRVARVRCDPLRAEVGFAIAAELLSRLFSIPAVESPERQRAALDDALREAGGTSAHRGFLEHLLGLDGGDAAPAVRDAARDPRLLADRMVEAWIEAVGLVAAREPTVLVVENLHGCDGPSVRLLERALTELDERPLLLFATARPEIDDVHPRAFASRPLDRIQLAPLARRAAEALVRGRLGADADASTVERIVDQGAGNPMFLLELAAAARDGLSTSPPSVVALLQERLERLEANARRVLRAASVLGQTFWLGAVEALVGAGDAASVGEWLAELVRRDLVDRSSSSRFPGEEELTFRSGLLRDAVYATLTDTDLVVGHRLAGQWLEAHAESDSLRLARHFELGHAPDAARVHLARAPALAFERNDLPTALELVRQVESLVASCTSPPPHGFAVVAAKVYYWSVDRPAAIDRAEHALTQVERGSQEWLELTAIRVRSLAFEDHERCVEVLTSLLDELEANPGLPRPSDAVIEPVVACLRSGQRELAERTIRVLSSGAPGPLADAAVLRARSWLAMYDGALDACIELDGAAAEVFETAGHTIEALSARAALAYGYLQVGQVDRARAEYEAVLERARGRSIGALAQVALHNLGIAHLWSGAGPRALELQREAMGYLGLGGPIVDNAACQAALALVVLERFDEAGQMLEPVLGRASGGVLAFARAAGARLALATGDVDRALLLTEDAMAEVRLGTVEEGEGSVRNAWTLALAAAGRDGDAARAARDAEAALRGRAGKIADPEVRRTFLEQVPENRETTRLFAERAGPSLD